MRVFKYILPLLVIMASCHPYYRPTTNHVSQYDSIYLIADIQYHKQHYPLLDKEVFSIDLLSDGLVFDSTHIVGTGLNLCFSDIFLPMTDTVLQEGIYHLDTTAAAYTFLPYIYFDKDHLTGCYMIDIRENQIQRIIGFTAGSFEITSLGSDIRMDISLYTADSTHYHAIYQGPYSR